MRVSPRAHSPRLFPATSYTAAVWPSASITRSPTALVDIPESLPSDGILRERCAVRRRAT